MARLRLELTFAAFALIAVCGCSSEDAGPGGGTDAGTDSPGTGGAGGTDASTDAPGPPTDSSTDGPGGTDGATDAAAGGKGIKLKVNGGAEEVFATGNTAGPLSTGWGIQASDGKTSNHGLTIVLRSLDAASQPITATPPTPGAYKCAVFGANAKNGSMQYNAPDTPAFAYGTEGECQIDLTQYGPNVGDPVVGTFTGKAKGIGNATIVDLAGSFDMVRTK